MARPASPIISRGRASSIALEVIDTLGLEKLSLRLVAARMGVKGASLYHHFQDRDDLLREVARHLLSKSPLPPISGTSWKKALMDVCHASWNAVLRHPNAAPLVLQFFPKHIALHTYEYWTELLAANGIPVSQHLWILEGSSRLTFGSALFAASARSRALPPFPKFDAEKSPHLHAAIRANRYSDEETFLATLKAFLEHFPDRVGEGAPIEVKPLTTRKVKEPAGA